MAHSYSVDEEVHHRPQGPQISLVPVARRIYTVVRCLPIERDGRVRYRIKCEGESFERVAFEDELSRPI